MKAGGVGKHYLADLYFCQNSLWKEPGRMETDISRLAEGLIKATEGLVFDWSYIRRNPEMVRVTGRNIDLYILIQIFPENKFLAVDLFSWQFHNDLQPFGESLIDLFAPQLIVSDARLRAEHI